MNNDELFNRLNVHGSHCVEKLNFAAAECAFQQALSINPKSEMIFSNLGALHWNMLDFDKAYYYTKEALKINPNYAAAHGNLGLLLDAENKFEEALKETNEAIRLDPKKIDYQWDRMITYMDMGDWERGFDEYWVRFRYKFKDYSPLPYPEWEGEDLNEKIIYMQTEQGVGDRILFARFLKVIKDKYPTCRILVATEPENYPLFWEYKRRKYIDEFVPFDMPYPKADFGVYLMSIAKALKLRPDNIPENNDLMLTHAQFYKNKFKPKTFRKNSLKIGICWSGNPLFVLNHWRSMPLTKMCQLIDDPDITFFSFQQFGTAEITKAGMTPMLFDLSEPMKTWHGTMACMQHMDLIISVDTSIVHLAGTLNIPVWNILNTASYWPYGRTDNTTTPWYPSMRLFRQKKRGDWDTVLDDVKEELLKFKAEKKKKLKLVFL